jgi:hypothetical protein
LVDLEDLLALEFTCDGCGSRLLHSIEKFRRVPTKCPNCAEDLIADGSKDAEIITAAFSSLRSLIERSGKVKVRLEVVVRPESVSTVGWVRVSFHEGRMFQDESSKEKVKKLAEVAAELAELSKQQSEALISSAYSRMSAKQMEEYDKRRLRIGELSELVSKFKPR